MDDNPFLKYAPAKDDNPFLKYAPAPAEKQPTPQPELKPSDYTVLPNGEFAFNDPQKQKEYEAGKADVLKSAAVDIPKGMFEGAAGLAGDIRGSLRSADTGIKSGLGKVASYLAPADRQDEIQSSIQKILTPFGVLATGAEKLPLPSTPFIQKHLTGEVDPNNNIQKIMRETGSVLAPVPGKGMIEGGKAVLGGVKKGYDYLKGIEHVSRGEAVLKDAEELRGGVKAQAAEKVKSIEAEAKAAGATADTKASELAKREAEFQTAARDTSPLKATEELRGQVSGVTTGKAAEQSTAATAKQAEIESAAAEKARHEASAADAEAKMGEIEESLKTRPQMTPVEFGAQVQKAADEVYAKALARREEESGFAKAVNSAGDKPIVSTRDIESYLKEAEKNVTNNSVKAVFQWVRENLTTPFEQANAKGTVKAIPLVKADNMRKDLNGALATKSLTLENQTRADISGAIHYINEIQKRLAGATGKASLEYRAALKKWAELSRDTDVFQRKGALKDVVGVDQFSRDHKMAEARVVGAAIKRTNEGGEFVGRLLSHDPKLQDSARMYFNHELFAGGKVPSVGTFDKWLIKNERSLKQLGLWDEFSQARGSRDAMRELAEYTGEARKKISETERNINWLSSAKTAAEEKVASLSQLDRVLKSERNPNDIVSKAESIVNHLSKEGLIEPEEHAKMLSNIRDVQAKHAEAADAQKRLSQMVGDTKKEMETATKAKGEAKAKVRSYQTDINNIGAGEARGAMGSANSLADKMLEDEVLTVAQHKEIVEKIADINARFKEKDDAGHRIKNLMTYILGTIGVGTAAKFGLHHIRRVTF